MEHGRYRPSGRLSSEKRRNSLEDMKGERCPSHLDETAFTPCGRRDVVGASSSGFACLEVPMS